MASGHVQAIVDAAAKAAGVQIGTNLSPAHDSLYAANGLHLSRNTLLPIEIDGRLEVPLEKSRPYMFRWGVARAVARDALISLLEMSATTLRWNLGCDPNPERAKTRCGLNLTPLQVQITGSDGQQEMRSLHFDRCVKCPALPPPSAQK